MRKLLRFALVLGILMVQLSLIGIAAAQGSAPASETFSLVLQKGLDGYAGVEDTFLFAWLAETPQSAVDPLVVRSDGAASALLRFDVSQIPAYATITSARLELYAESRNSPATFSLSAHRVLRPWVPSQATWHLAAIGDPWEAPGCEGVGVDRRAAAVDTVELDGIGQWYGLDVTGQVNLWLDEPEINHGLILRGESTQAMEYRFFSSEHWHQARRPRLVIEYAFEGPTPTGTPTFTRTLTPTASATPTTTPTATSTPGPRQVSSQALTGMLAMDGYHADWLAMSFSPAFLNAQSADTVWPNRAVSGSDCSVVMRSAWDPWYLYFSFDVTDDEVQMPDYLGEPIQHTDSIELALDGNGDGVWGGPNDHRFSIQPTGQYVHVGSGEPAVIVRGETKGVDEGYFIEFAIPWVDLLPSGTPHEGLSMPFNMAIHDDDDWGSYDAYFIWEGNAIDNAADFGALILDGQNDWYHDLYQQGLDGYAGVQDTYLSVVAKTTNYGNSGDLVVSWDGSHGMEEAAALLRFDLPYLADARVHRATLRLYASARYHSPPDLKIYSYQVRRHWVADQANWYNASAMLPWGAPGCNDTFLDYNPEASDQYYIRDNPFDPEADDINRWYELDVTYMASQWINNSADNEGVVIKAWRADSVRGYKFVSSNHLQTDLRPQLEIIWSYPQPTPTATWTHTATPTGTATPTHTATVSPTSSPTYTATPYVGSIAGIVFDDRNGNGFQDPGEGGVPNVIVRLYESYDGFELDQRVTRVDGAFGFTGLSPQLYYVRVDTPTGYELTTPEGWDVFVSAGGTAGVPFGMRLRATPTLTHSATPTQSATPTLSPTLTDTATVTWTPMTTPTWTASVTPSATGTPVDTATPSLTPTSTATRLPTQTATFSITPTLVPTATATSVSSPTATRVCVSTTYWLKDDFDQADLAGWQMDLADGSAAASSGIAQLAAAGAGSSRYPLLWRNDVFPVTGSFEFVTRFRFLEPMAHGVSLGLGTLPFDGTRYLEGESAIAGMVDLLQIYHDSDAFWVALREQPLWSDDATNQDWHVVRLSYDGYRYSLEVDGALAGRIAGKLWPRTVNMGSALIASEAGMWTRIEVDYCYVLACGAWSESIVRLPMLLKVP